MNIPSLSLVVLIGASGSGKSTFAARHFAPSEVVSSDACRMLVADDPDDQTATVAAFEVLHTIVAKRLEAGRLTVVDATNVQPHARAPLVEAARRFHAIPVAIVLDVPERVCAERSRHPAHAVRRHVQQLRRSVRRLEREGFRHVHVLRSTDGVTVERRPLWCDRRDLAGPFDVIGDVHGCADELAELLETLGYAGDPFTHPDGRIAIFLGDLVDRGPRILDTLRTVMSMVRAGTALCVPGNHDVKLVRKLRGRDVRITHGLDRTLAEIEPLAEAERSEIADFLDGLTSHYVLDAGRLVVAHAGMRAEMAGRGSRKVRDFALYGETTGETDEFGLPVRYDWAATYRGSAVVVYGHTPVPDPEWVNRTINIDTGCVFGGRLTALRYPESELVSVRARAVHCDPVKPFAHASAEPARRDDLLDIADVTGTRRITTRLAGEVTVREDQAAAALEVMSRFAIDPRWLVHLPPTMSPTRTAQRADLLEHPDDAFAYYRQEGVPVVVCEEKHMGSRAIVVVCRDPDVAPRRFGVDGIGACYTRTGRPFFADGDALLERVSAAVPWDELDTDWLVLDAEIMPWTVKASELVVRQYASVGAAGTAAMRHALDVLPSGDLRDRYAARAAQVDAYVAAYRRYCEGELRIAPFHLLAAEGRTFFDTDHRRHMETIARVVTADEELFAPTQYRIVDVTDGAQTDAATAWWEELTAAGGEGMVVKPLPFVVRGRKGIVQPGVKCRGREYLRIIYGPEYTSPDQLERLRPRALGLKRSLAVREFALGVEALERFVRGEPLSRVHACVFAVLALESEPVDPRL